MEAPSLIDFLLGALVTVLTWAFKKVWEELKETKAANKTLHDRVVANELATVKDYLRKDDFERSVDMLSNKLEKLAGLEILLAHNYVGSTAFERAIDNVMSRLDRIEDKLDKKADKVE